MGYVRIMLSVKNVCLEVYTFTASEWAYKTAPSAVWW